MVITENFILIDIEKSQRAIIDARATRIDFVSFRNNGFRVLGGFFK
jgi:hypothetical protein